MKLAVAKRIVARAMIRDAALGRVPARDAVAAFADAGFEESKHPRGEGGRFGSAVESDKNARHHAKRSDHHATRAAEHAKNGNQAAAEAHSAASDLHDRARKVFSGSTRAFVRGDYAKGDQFAKEAVKHSKNAQTASNKANKLGT